MFLVLGSWLNCSLFTIFVCHEYDEFVSLLFHLAALRQWPN